MIDVNKLSEDVTIPRFCQDMDDFCKYYLAVTTVYDDIEQKTIGIKLLLHEYLALVLAGKIPPYATETPTEDVQDAFRGVMMAVTERVTKANLPMKEEDGKMKIDEDKILRGKHD